MNLVYIALFALVAAVIQLLVLATVAKRVSVLVLVPAAAGLAVLVYQACSYAYLGVLDPFFLIAAATQFGIALVIGAGIAVILRRYSSAPVSSP